MDSNLYLSRTAHIFGNIATSYAPGIYNGGNLYVEDSTVNEDGVYIVTENNIVKINGALSSDAVIQLDTSDYITPDESKAPIVVAIVTDSYPLLTTTDLKAFRKPTVGFERWHLYLNADNNQILLGLIPIEEYSITYQNLHGATHTNPTTYTSETPTIILTPPSKVRCRLFIGWYNENGIKITEIPQGTVGNIVLTANWENVGICKEKIGYICMPKKIHLCQNKYKNI